MVFIYNASILRRTFASFAKSNIPTTVLSCSVNYMGNIRHLSSQTPKKLGIIDRLFGIETCEASPDFKNRWLMAIPGCATHICLGAPWAWSLMADVITREKGFVASTALDWSLLETAIPLSLVFILLGASASVLGNWQNQIGVRKALLYSSCAFGGGLVLGSIGIYTHSLPLVYLGYGVIGGLGTGLAYTPPIQTLLQWFPDKKGIASGLTIAGFGSGALLFTPAAQYLMKKFTVLPEYIGPTKDFILKNVDGRYYTDLNGVSVEVIEAVTSDLAKLPYQLSEGLYIVGSGSTGAAPALAVMGVTYFAVILASALAIKKPHSSYIPPQAAITSSIGDNIQKTCLEKETNALSPLAPLEISRDEAIRSKQFHLLGITFASLAMGGMGVMSVAKPMMSEVFSGLLPNTVNAAFAAQFLLMLAAANLGGRFGWAAMSDYVGRKNMFRLFTFGSIPLYLSMPFWVNSVVQTGSEIPLYCFIGSCVGAVSMMGGTYAVLPAYESDLYGIKNVGPIHGTMMLYSAAAALFGPYMFIKIKTITEKNEIIKMLPSVNSESFANTFGAPIEQANQLIANKSLTLAKLVAIAPEGTIDPTPHLYDGTMYTLGGLMVVAAIAQSRVNSYVPQHVINDILVAKENEINSRYLDKRAAKKTKKI